VDGIFLTTDPQVLLQQGSVADIPFISGKCKSLSSPAKLPLIARSEMSVAWAGVLAGAECVASSRLHSMLR